MTDVVTITIPVAISAVSLFASVFFSNKSNRRADTKDIEERVAHNTKIDMKLDEINRNVIDVKYDLSALKKDVQAHSERLAKLEGSVKTAHERIDSITGQKRIFGGSERKENGEYKV